MTDFTELTTAIFLQADYQRTVAREHYLWLRRTSGKPFAPPTRDSIAQDWVKEQAFLVNLRAQDDARKALRQAEG